MACKNLVQTLPNTFHVAAWNVNGLQEGTKEHEVLYHLGKLSSDIVFLQDFHVKPGQIQYLQRQWWGRPLKLHSPLGTGVWEY